MPPNNFLHFSLKSQSRLDPAKIPIYGTFSGPNRNSNLSSEEREQREDNESKIDEIISKVPSQVSSFKIFVLKCLN